MKLREEIIKAIIMTIDELGSESELARKTGVKQQNISRYISNQIHNITLETWTKLYPYIKRHLPPGFQDPSHTPHSSHISQTPVCAITERALCPFNHATPAKKYLIDTIDKLDDDDVETLIAKALDLKNAPNTLPAVEVGESSQIRKTAG